MVMISPHAPSVIILNSLISSYNSFCMLAPFWKTIGIVTIHAIIAITLRPMADDAAKSVGVIFTSSLKAQKPKLSLMNRRMYLLYSVNGLCYTRVNPFIYPLTVHIL